MEISLVLQASSHSERITNFMIHPDVCVQHVMIINSIAVQKTTDKLKVARKERDDQTYGAIPGGRRMSV